MKGSGGDSLSSTQSIQEVERINSVRWQREINLCLSSGRKCTGVSRACWSPSIERTISLSHSPALSITLPRPLLSLSISLLTFYFLDMSICLDLWSGNLFVTFGHITSFLPPFFSFSIPVLSLSPIPLLFFLLLLLTLPTSLMMCLAFKASHCCITGLFVSPKREKKDSILLGHSKIFYMPSHCGGQCICMDAHKLPVLMTCTSACTHSWIYANKKGCKQAYQLAVH